ncbi:MAG: site-2 protease family protein [Fervidicoccaceae archaeon]
MATTLEIVGAIALYWGTILLIFNFLKNRMKDLQVNPIMIIYKKETTLSFLERIAGKKWLRPFLYAGILLTFLSLFLFYYTILGVVASRFISTQATGGLVPIIPGITITGTAIIYVLFSIGISATIHELAHAIASRAVGIPIKSVGFILSIFIPAAFVEPDEEKFNSAGRLKRAQVLSAGPASNFIAGLIFLLVLSQISVAIPGASIVSTDDGYPAQQAGLNPGLVILAINGTQIATPGDISPIISKYANVSATFNITVYDPKTNTTFWKLVYKPSNFSRIGITVEQARAPSPIPDFLYFPLTNLLFYLYIINISLAIINAAPIFITDGGKLVNDIIAWKFSGNTAKTLNFFVQIFTLLLILSSITFTPIQ